MIDDCTMCQQLRDEIADLQNEMRELQREHDYHYQQLENELRMCEREVDRGY